jgi:hypothetical protein
MTVADFKGLPESLDIKRIAFTRNPYDRLYSGFLQVQKDISEQPQMPYAEPWIKKHVLRQLSMNAHKLTEAHYDFDEWVALLEPEDIYQIGGNSSFPMYPAHYWTHDADKPFVDFTGKVESFEEDFIKMLDFLRISDSYNLDNDNVNILPDKSAATVYKYIDKMSGSSIEKINGLFEKDFQLFGYRIC